MIIQGARSASGNDIGIVNDYLKYIKNVIEHEHSHYWKQKRAR